MAIAPGDLPGGSFFTAWGRGTGHGGTGYLPGEWGVGTARSLAPFPRSFPCPSSLVPRPALLVSQLPAELLERLPLRSRQAIQPGARDLVEQPVHLVRARIAAR